MATPILVGVTTGVMKPLLSKLTKLLEEEYVKLKGVRKQIKFLRDELGAMSATLQMLADAEQLDPETREWRNRLRELAYDLEDCIDAFMARVDHEPDGRSSGCFKSFFLKLKKLKKLKTRHEIANQIEELKASVIDASKRHKRYAQPVVSQPLLKHKSSSSSSSVYPRLQALYQDIDKLVGIDGPKKHIIELLNMEMDGSSAKLKVVSISGCGGLGKTTLAKQVYDTIKRQFKCASFVSVSCTPDVKKILKHIADGVKCPGINTQDDNEQQLIDKLREHLNDKRYIVVIDDVWNTKDWGFIKLALPDNDCGSRIIMTTRSATVAKCSSQVHEMEALSFDDSKRLLFRTIFGSENSCYPHLEDVPDKILSKCHGLPLAIVTLSGILAKRTNVFEKAEWDRVLSAIGSSLAKNDDAKMMTSILSLSYFDMPHHLRTCFLYLSVYPEDYYIEKQCLINRWIAEGFIHEEEGQTKYEIGEGYFNELINRSMIQPVDVKYCQANKCRVHDIILDYINCKAAEENFVTSVDAAKPAYTSEYKVRRLCVTNNNEENVTIWEDQILSHVRSVTIFGQPVEFSLLPSTALRVLDLGHCKNMLENHHLAGFRKLFNLKYLCLHSHSITMLPEDVGELQHLQTLDVRYSSGIRELPRTITKLQKLAHLYVRWYVSFPEGMIEQMHSLEELTEYGIRSVEQGKKSIQEFSKLKKLRKVKIKWNVSLDDSSEGRCQGEPIHSYVGNLLSSCNLHNLIYTEQIFSQVYLDPLALHSWRPAASCSIRKLCMKRIPIYRVPNWLGSLGNLSVLKLMVICVRPEDVEILGKIPSLLFLTLCTVGGTSGRIVFPGNSGFRILKYFSLAIGCCGTSLEFEAGSMPKLEHVNLVFSAHEMECLNGASSLGFQHLSSLNKVEIIINGGRDKDGGNYNPAEDDHDDTVRHISRAINADIKTLRNHPTVMFEIKKDDDCQHFESALREWNRETEGSLDDWLKLWQIRKELAEESTDSETEQEDDSHENKEEEWTEKHEETNEKEVAQQDDGGSSLDQSARD